MKFGIFYELQIPRPWEKHSEHRLHHNALDQVELADKLGYDYAWEVEHHFLEEYSHSPAPKVFLGAASQRTKNIRLGHGIIQLTTNHPARVVERVSTLDLLSNGRVEFGMGESASKTELDPFGVAFEDKREIWEEMVQAIIPMFGDEPVSFDGKHFFLAHLKTTKSNISVTAFDADGSPHRHYVTREKKSTGVAVTSFQVQSMLVTRKLLVVALGAYSGPAVVYVFDKDLGSVLQTFPLREGYTRPQLIFSHDQLIVQCSDGGPILDLYTFA